MPVPPPSVRVSCCTRPHGEAGKQWGQAVLQVMAVISATAHTGCSTTTLKQLHTHAEVSIRLSGIKKDNTHSPIWLFRAPNALLVLLQYVTL